MRTAASILLSMCCLVPGFAVGWIASIIYVALVGHILQGGIFNWLTDGALGHFNLAVIPSFVRGFVGGLISIFLASKILKQCEFKTAAFANSTIIIIGFFIGTFYEIPRYGFGLELAETISETAGIITGLFFMAINVEENNRRREPDGIFRGDDVVAPSKIHINCQNVKCDAVLRLEPNRAGWINCPRCGRRQYIQS
jgi:hypothetical protein